MSYTQSGSHLASISRDPLDTGYEGSGNQGSSFRASSARGRHLSDYSSPHVESASSDMVRPLLLAGALGLFAAWVVSGLDVKGRLSTRPYRGRGYVPGDDLSSSRRRDWQNVSETRHRDQGRFGGSTPPEGRSPVRDFELDAMNP